MERPLIEYVKSITDPALDITCDTKLTCGESLTILRQARRQLTKQIHELRKTIERQTAKGPPDAQTR